MHSPRKKIFIKKLVNSTLTDFLVGYARTDNEYGSPTTVKYQFLTFIHSVRTVMRIPLIGVNIAMIVFKLVFG
ncbi:Immediate early response 3-interacting protein 1 [Schistosoma japonicum]|nr:Immediate early response 3-interacting protein 1 [Schistosoma japonicum]